MTLPLVLIGLAVGAFVLHDFYASLIGAAVGYFGFVVVEISYKRLRGIGGLGRGDAKLLAAGGAWCTVWGLPWILLLSSLSGLVWVFVASRLKGHSIKATDAVPFGPFLSIGIFLTWLAETFGPALSP